MYTIYICIYILASVHNEAILLDDANDRLVVNQPNASVVVEIIVKSARHFQPFHQLFSHFAPFPLLLFVLALLLMFLFQVISRTFMPLGFGNAVEISQLFKDAGRWFFFCFSLASPYRRVALWICRSVYQSCIVKVAREPATNTQSHWKMGKTPTRTAPTSHNKTHKNFIIFYLIFFFFILFLLKTIKCCWGWISYNRVGREDRLGSSLCAVLGSLQQRLKLAPNLKQLNWARFQMVQLQIRIIDWKSGSYHPESIERCHIIH